MLAAAPHRGADLAVSLCGRCVLGVSNKADFTDSSISTKGQIMAAFSGKLDNAADLTSLVKKAGHAPVSVNAADIVVSLFETFGPGAPNHMRGVFAGIVTNGRELWCFRDHLGFKPLYYRDEPRAFFVATEAKQVLAGASLRREPNIESLERILFGKKYEDPPCALQGANHIRQATTYTSSIDSGIQRHIYWHPEAFLETARIAPADVGERFAELFGQAVSRSLTGNDVISLSGGIDSSAIAAFAAPLHVKLTGRPLTALSAVFPDHPKVDESRYIQMIVDYLGMDLHTYRIGAKVLDDVEHWCNLLDGPVPTVSIPEMYENYALARQIGYRNILTGEIAEYVVGFRAHTMGHLLTHGRWKALWRLAATELKRGKSWRWLVRELLTSVTPGQVTNWYLHSRRRDHRRWIPDWVNHQKVRDAPYRPDLLISARNRWSQQQLVAFKGATLIDEADELCADLSGVTLRRPFADIDLWEFFLSLPAEVKIPDLRLKTLMRGLLRGRLPDAILDRSDKTSFNDHMLSQVNYPILRQFLITPNHVFDGVDYSRLTARLERENLNLFEWMWASTLVRVHAFLSLT
jgi:asparagine synthase (glutamine-hydrolysing)